MGELYTREIIIGDTLPLKITNLNGETIMLLDEVGNLTVKGKITSQTENWWTKFKRFFRGGSIVMENVSNSTISITN